MAELLGEDGGPPRQSYSALVSELQAVSAEMSAVRQAQRVHADHVAELRYRRSAQIAAEFRPRHREAVARIGEVLDELVVALLAEQKVRDELVAAGADRDALPAFTLNLGLLRERCRVYLEDKR